MNSYYYQTLELLESIKLVWGPVALNGTLKKHPKIATMIKQTQKNLLDEIESNL